MGSDCSLVDCFRYFLACSPGGTSKFAKDGQPASGFHLCHGKVGFPVCLLSNVTPSHVAFLSSVSIVPLLVPAFCFRDRANKVLEDLSLLTATNHFSVLLLGLSAAKCILYVTVVAYSSLRRLTKSSAYSCALVPLRSSDTRSLMKRQE